MSVSSPTNTLRFHSRLQTLKGAVVCALAVVGTGMTRSKRPVPRCGCGHIFAGKTYRMMGCQYKYVERAFAMRMRTCILRQDVHDDGCAGARGAGPARAAIRGGLLRDPREEVLRPAARATGGAPARGRR
eukprot:7565311-Pyramimonas_sp.AAC.1